MEGMYLAIAERAMLEGAAISRHSCMMTDVQGADLELFIKQHNRIIR